MWKLPDGRIIKHPQPIEADGVRHPRDIFVRWSDEELAGIGIRRIVADEYDHEHYVAVSHKDVERENKVWRTYKLAPRYTLEELRTRKVERVKVLARSLLAETDWMVIREADDPGRPVPAAVKVYRDAIRKASDALEEEINKADYATLSKLDVVKRLEAIKIQ